MPELLVTFEIMAMCVLHVTSSMDSFAKFVATTRLPVYRSHEKGDVKENRKGATRDNYGFSCDVSTRHWIDACGQIEDAIRFFKTYSAELRSLLDRHRIDDIRLDFPIESRLSDSVLFQFDYLPPDLIRYCAEYGIGIEISHYAPGQSEDCKPDATPSRSPTTPGNSEVTKEPPSVS